jgi:hypothetical protein
MAYFEFIQIDLHEIILSIISAFRVQTTPRIP